MIFDVSHQTVYSYAGMVAQSHHIVHLAPRPHPRQRVIRHRMSVEPAPAARNDFIDFFGNPVSVLYIGDSHDGLSVRANSIIEVSPAPPFDMLATTPWDRLGGRLGLGAGPHDLDVVQYICPTEFTEPSPDIEAYVRPSFVPGRPVLDAVMDLTARIHADFIYDDSATEVATHVRDVLAIRRGVCQDFAHLQIAGLRALGLPARYISGYLMTRPPEGQEKLAGADASHAWISVWAPETGWVDFDPTNNLIVSDEHLTIAHGRDFGDVSPISGVILGGGDHTVEVAVDVTQALGPH
jgi:transglutaminase-like putative cysteine protease